MNAKALFLMMLLPLLMASSCSGKREEPVAISMEGPSIGFVLEEVRQALDIVAQQDLSKLPPFSVAKVSIETVAKRVDEGKVQVVEVAGGGSVSNARTQTVTLTIKPDKSRAAASIRSGKPIEIKEQLASAIIQAAQQAEQALPEPSLLALTELVANVKFVVERSKEASAGFKIEVLSMDVGGKVTGADSATNTVEVTFKYDKPEEQFSSVTSGPTETAPSVTTGRPRQRGESDRSSAVIGGNSLTVQPGTSGRPRSEGESR